MQDNSCLLVVTLYSDTGKIKFHVSRQRGNIYLQFIDEGIIYTSLIVYFDELIKVYHPIHRGFKGNNSSGLHLFLQCTHLLNLNFCLSYAYTCTYLSFLYILQCIKMKSVQDRNLSLTVKAFQPKQKYFLKRFHRRLFKYQSKHLDIGLFKFQHFF